MTKIYHLTDESGVSFKFSPHNAPYLSTQPLGLAELVEVATHQTASVPLVTTNASAPVEQTGLPAEGPLTLTMQLQVGKQVIAYGLVPGGWLPLPWANRAVALLDRNVIGILEQLEDQDQDTFESGSINWLAKWVGLDVAVVSPVLFVLEGNRKRPPTYFEMRVQLNRAVKALQKNLPLDRIQKVSALQLRALYRLVVNYSEARVQATNLLRNAVPLIVESTKESFRLNVETQLVALARKEKVSTGSLVFLALLSCLYDHGPGCKISRYAKPGRLVIKPSKTYSDEDAYNTLSDLLFLELLIQMPLISEDPSPVLYTRDLGITAFWAALQSDNPQATRVPGGTVKANFALDKGLLPALTPEAILELKRRLAL